LADKTVESEAYTVFKSVIKAVFVFQSHVEDYKIPQGEDGLFMLFYRLVIGVLIAAIFPSIPTQDVP